MKINSEQLESIARLARLKINSQDLDKFEKNFNEIISYVELLQKVEIPEDSSEENIFDFTQILAEDKVEKFQLTDWQRNVNKKSNDYIAVKAIFNDEQR